MLPLIIFIVIIASVFLAGAILSYPLYLILSPVIETGFHKYVHYSTLLTGLLLGIYYLKATGQLSKILGFKETGKVIQQHFLYGFIAGLTILLVVELSLYGLGMRQVDPDLYNSTSAFISVIIKAMVVGLVVGVMEETLYRGAIFTGLQKYINFLSALIVSSLLYAAVHFIDFPELSKDIQISWIGGFITLFSAFEPFIDPHNLDSFISLFLLGLLFGIVRWHNNNIIACTGLHAGIVTLNKITAYATDYKQGSPYDFLVNTHDHLNGYLASFWIVIAILFYYFCFIKRDSKSE